MKMILAVVMVVLLSGCTSLADNVQLVSSGSNQPSAKLLVYREGAFQAGIVGMYVGKQDQYFLRLNNDQYSIFAIDPGTHIIQVKADASPAGSIQVTLKPEETQCLRGKPNPQALAAVAMPIIANMVPAFELELVPCPDEAQLAELWQVAHHAS